MPSPITFSVQQTQVHTTRHLGRYSGLCQKGSVVTINTLLYSDKTLICTKKQNPYQNENRASYIKFIVSLEDLSDFSIEEMQCVLCVNLPDETSGNINLLQYSKDKKHSDYISASIPITKTISGIPGQLKMWIIFSYQDKDSLMHYLPTNKVTLDILESNSNDSYFDPGESENIFS